LKLVNSNKANYITDEVIYHPRWKISFDSNLFTIMHLYCHMICLGIDFEDIYLVQSTSWNDHVISFLCTELEFEITCFTKIFVSSSRVTLIMVGSSNLQMAMVYVNINEKRPT
jgi:hypothetical protein